MSSSQFGDLTKLYVEAKDNVKFLTTLERHFKNISYGTLTQVLDTLPPMMGALRMWSNGGLKLLQYFIPVSPIYKLPVLSVQFLENAILGHPQ
eukprot:703284-Prorocentrum_minimum.AAC.1